MMSTTRAEPRNRRRAGCLIASLPLVLTYEGEPEPTAGAADS